MRQFADGFGGLAHQRQHHVITAFAQHQGVGQVVDVLAGAGEADELADSGQFRQLEPLLLEQVFDGLYVVVGGALDLLIRSACSREKFSARVFKTALASAENASLR